MAIVAQDENEQQGQTTNGSQAPAISPEGLTANLTAIQPGAQTGATLPSASTLIGGKGAGGAPTGGIVSPSNTAMGSTPIGGAPGASSTGPSSSGNFANTNAYVANNQGNTNQLANNVDQFLTNTANTTGSTLNSNVGSFNAAVGTGTVTDTNNLLGQEAQQGATNFVQNGSNLTGYQNLVNGTYSGPSSFTGSQYEAASTPSISQYDQYVTDVQNPNQYGGVLQGMNNGSLYTTGQQNLDSLLLQNSPTAQSNILSTIGSNPNFDQLLGSAETAGSNTVANAQATTAATNQAASGQVTSQESTLQSQVNDAVTALQNTDQASQTAIANALTTGSALTDAQVQSLGLTPTQWSTLQSTVGAYNSDYGNLSGDLTNLSGYYTPTGLNQITANNTATPEQYAQLAALNSLMGPNAAQDTFINTPGQAGQAQNLQLGTYNYGGNLQDINTAQQTDSALLNQRVNNQTLVAPVTSPLSTAAQIGGILQGAASLKNVANTVGTVYNYGSNLLGMGQVSPAAQFIDPVTGDSVAASTPGAVPITSQQASALASGASPADIGITADTVPDTTAISTGGGDTVASDIAAENASGVGGGATSALAGAGGALAGAGLGYEIGSQIGEGAGRTAAEVGLATVGAVAGAAAAGVDVLGTIATIASVAAC